MCYHSGEYGRDPKTLTEQGQSKCICQGERRYQKGIERRNEREKKDTQRKDRERTVTEIEENKSVYPRPVSDKYKMTAPKKKQKKTVRGGVLLVAISHEVLCTKNNKNRNSVSQGDLRQLSQTPAYSAGWARI